MLGALAFLTPLGSPRPPRAGDAAWFPVVGALLGALLGGAWWLAGQGWPPLLAAVLVVALDAALTGMLHLDGLADTADGVLPAHLPRERRLEVMREPTSGAFALVVVVLTLALRVAALAALAPSVPLLAALWCASRSAMALAMARLPAARPAGLASAFGSVGAGPAVVGLAAAAALGAAAEVAVGAAVVASVAAAGAVLVAAARRLGGWTGDVLGAAGVVAETVGLLVAAGTLW